MFLPEAADQLNMMQADDLVEQELMLNRFNRLMRELMRGVITRNVFQPWEIDLLLDIETCPLDRRRRLEVMRQYQKAVERQLDTGPGPPLKLSAFLAMRAAAKEERLRA
jgi:hypothetical protein